MAQKVALVTKQVVWIKLREQVTADDTTVLGVTTRDFDSRNVGTGDAVRVPEAMNNVMITFLGKPADQSEPFIWTLYGYRADNGMAEKLAYGTGNLGDVAATVHPITGIAATDLYYADFLTITAQYHVKTIAIVDSADGGHGIAKIAFDLAGFKYLLLELTDCYYDEASETDQLEAIYTGF